MTTTPKVPDGTPLSNGNGNGGSVDSRFGEIPPELAALDDEVAFDADALPTLAQIGKVLPIGYRDQSGTVHREFELCEWGWDTEEELGDLAEKEGEMTMPVYVSEVVGRGLAKLGAIDFSRLKRSQRRLIVSNLYFADVLYVYVWIRIGALGHQLRLEEFKCPKCRKSIDYVGDLRSLEVKVVSGEGGKVPTERVELPRKFSYAGAERDTVTVGPLKWAFMETDDESTLTNPAKLRRATMRHGIVSVEGAPEGPVVLSTVHLKQIGSKGVNRIVGAIDEIGGGAVMQIEGRCPKCRKDFPRQTIDWSHGDFFGRSSR